MAVAAVCQWVVVGCEDDGSGFGVAPVAFLCGDRHGADHLRGMTYETAVVTGQLRRAARPLHPAVLGSQLSTLAE